MQKPNLKRRY